MIIRTDNVPHAGPVFASANGNSTSATAATSRRVNSVALPVAGTTVLATSAFRTSVQFSFVLPCAGIPAPGNTTGPTGACSGTPFTLGLQTPTTGAGVTYQWQTSPDGFTWAPAPGASTNSTYSATQSVATHYRCLVTCSGNTTPSNGLFVPINPLTACYCTASANNGTFERISNVSLGTLNNASTGTTGYEDFTSISACLFTSTAYPVSITVANAYATDDRVYIWIDTDQNGVFANPGELVYTANVSTFCPTCAGTTPATLTGTVTIPGAANLGTTRMRIRLQDNSSAPANTTPCGASAFGQVEDYNVNLQVAPTCLPTSGLTSTVLSSSSASLNWTENNTPAAGQWQIEYGPEGFAPGTGTFVSTASKPYTLTGLGSVVRYDYYVYPDCGSGFVLPPCSAAKGRIIMNDNCVGAVELTMGGSCAPTLGNSSNSTMDTPSCSAGAGATTDGDVWFTFLATGTFGTIQIAPAAGAAAYYPTIELLSGTGCSLLSTQCCTFAGGAGQTLTVQRQLVVGQRYWMRVGHAFAGGSGNNQFNICVFQSVPPAGPCVFTATPDLTEIEPCGSGDNSNCLFAEPLAINGMPALSTYQVNGTVYGECNLRDIDYFTFTLTAERNLQISLKGQFPSQLVLNNTSAGCPGTQIGATVTALACANGTITQLLQPGTYTLFVTTNAVFNNIPCGSSLTQYELLFTDLAVPTGACCLLDGTCGQLTQSQCAAVWGSYSGNNTLCSGVTCPAPISCGDGFFDSGGAANPYSADEDRTVRICSNDPLNTQARVTFSAFDLEASFDALYVYDGNTPNAPLISSGNPATATGFPAGGYYGTGIPGPFTSSDVSGCLTFRFRSEGSVQNAGWNAAVSCVTPSSCAAPSAVAITATTASSATVSWNCLFCTTPYYVEVGPVGFVPGTDNNPGGGTVYTTTASPFTVTGLLSGQTYALVIRHDCVGGLYSPNSTPVTFNTPPTCGDNFYDSGGPGANYTNLEDITTVICATTPQDIVTVAFSNFDVEATWDALYVYDGPTTSSPLIGSANPGTNSGYPAGGWYGNAIPGPFTSTDLSGCLTFRFRSDDSFPLTGWTAGVTCATPPACRVPTGTSMSGISATGATVSWNCAGCTGAYIVEYGPTGFTPGFDANSGGGGSTVITGATSPTVLGGLAANQLHDVYVRQDCNNSSNGFGANSALVQFTTLIDCASAPALDCFVPTTVNLSGVGQWNIVNCGQPTPGKEKLYLFTAPAPGAYTLQVLSASGGLVDYLFKPAGACTSAGWSCINEFGAPGSATIILPSAGAYYVLADAETTGSSSQTFRMICPVTNTSCATAAPMTCGSTVYGNTVGAPNSLPPSACPFNGAASLSGVNWFSFAAASTEDVTFSACGQTDFDSRLSIFRADPDCNNLVCVATSDDVSGCPLNSSEVTVAVSSGSLYYVAVHGSGNAEGLFSLGVFCVPTCTPVTTNDACSSSTTLVAAVTGTGTFTTGDNGCAHVDAPTTCSGILPLQGVWFTFNSGASSVHVLDLASSSENPAYTSTGLSYALYSGACTSYGSLGELSCDATGAGANTLNLVPNTDYRLLVYNQGGIGVEGTFGVKLERPGVYDASIVAVLDPTGSLCDSQFEATVRLKNLGEATLTSTTITLAIDGIPVLTYPWTGSLATGAQEDVLLPVVSTTGGAHVLTATTSLPNGAVDEIPTNDAATSNYNADGQTVKVVVTTDNGSGAATWIIYDQFFSPNSYSGGPYGSNTTNTETVCLSAALGNQWSFYLFDSFGDGICCTNGNGSWQLRDRFDRSILADKGQFTTQSPPATPLSPAYANGHEFTLPLGPAQPQSGECGVFTNLLQEKINCTPVSGATSYQYEFSDPDAGFRRRVLLNRTYVQITDMQSNPLSLGQVYFLRVRADQGAPGVSDDRWGAGCEVGWSATAAFCTQLISTPGPTFSCGVTRRFAGSDKVWAQPIPGVVPFDGNADGDLLDAMDVPNPYQFRFTGTGSNSGYVRNIFRPNYICPLSWVTNPLVNGLTYDVQVQVFVGGQWKGFCGNTCQLTINNTPAQGGRTIGETSSTDNVQLWPNPVRDGRVNLRIDGLAEAEQNITVDVFDVFGKRVFTQEYGNSGELFNTVLVLNSDIASGLYMVNITVNDRTYTKRVSVL
jgi:hypothetical protein